MVFIFTPTTVTGVGFSLGMVFPVEVVVNVAVKLRGREALEAVQIAAGVVVIWVFAKALERLALLLTNRKG